MTPAREKRDRRADIVEAALRCMAERGYDRTSTARICAAAGVSSGTFFHYFPSKAAVLVAILETDLERVRHDLDLMAEAAGRDAREAIALWRETVVAEAADPDLAGFAAVLGSVPDHPEVAAALAREDELTLAGLTDVLARGQGQGSIRTDLPAHRLAAWLKVIQHGVLASAIDARGPVSEIASELADTVERLLRP